MDNHSLLLFFCFPLLLFLSESVAIDTMSANGAIKDGETIVSNGGMFELGFFSPTNLKNRRYVGIWYKKISYGTVVWVANKETPITDKSGMFKLCSNGSLRIVNGDDSKIWSSNSTVSARIFNPIVQLLNTGNLVVRDKNGTNQNLIWQSFDYPGNTLLPGVKFGKDFLTGIDRRLTSWKSPDDPSPGLYTFSMNTNGYPQMFERKGSDLHSRTGPWNGIRFHGLPIDTPNQLHTTEFIVNQKEVYYKFELNTSIEQRIVLRSDGTTVKLHWIERIQDWVGFGGAAIDECSSYGLCGPYGSCSINRYPPCRCMEGFVPTLQEEWNAADWSNGCKLRKPLTCGIGEGFKRVSGLKFPDTQRSWYDQGMTLEECEMACKSNCSCTAYANLDVRNGGSGCLLWFGELVDIREYDEDHNLYIRMATSELKGVAKSRGTKGALITVLAFSSAALLLCAVAYAYKNKKKRPHMKVNKDKKNTGVQIEDIDELPYFSLNEIAKATNNFSINNKIGEGGFGPVYKGVLKDGEEVAVKRLSETSQQGLEEFKNEVICIAKLQHRNLVKLLGYCTHGNEMILIYEYIHNNSLDSVIYDDTRSQTLDWPKRFSIIHGMARGILYLHQDSRLQIIHRDLKAGNILLDNDMNPKISDFGLARKFIGFDNATKTKKVVGTYGYISPEYAVYGRFSTKSDVFSFGVLVLEMVSGKRNREFSHEDHRDTLLGHAWRLYKEGRSIELMSASLHDSCILSEVQRSIHVGLLCVQHHAEDRPTMLSVVLMLVGEGALPQPKQPGFFTAENHHEVEPASSVNECTITLMYAR